MVVSFTVSKKGKRYSHQPSLVKEVNTNEQDQDFQNDGSSSTQTHIQTLNQTKFDPPIHTSSAKAKSDALFKSTLEQLEALGPSFSLNLFENGFTIGNTEEFFQYIPENLIPYNMHTESILNNIEYGRLPTGILHDDMPCKYVNGTVLCEVRDFRVFMEFPVINTVPLKMGLDNIIEDISYMSRDFSYGDRLKFESRVLNALNPHLNLDPTIMFDFCKETIPVIDLGIERGIKRRKMDMSTPTDSDSVLDRFFSINMLTRRNIVAERKPLEFPNFMTPVYSPYLLATHLSEEEVKDS